MSVMCVEGARFWCPRFLPNVASRKLFTNSHLSIAVHNDIFSADIAVQHSAGMDVSQPLKGRHHDWRMKVCLWFNTYLGQLLARECITQLTHMAEFKNFDACSGSSCPSGCSWSSCPSGCLWSSCPSGCCPVTMDIARTKDLPLFQKPHARSLGRQIPWSSCRRPVGLS